MGKTGMSEKLAGQNVLQDKQGKFSCMLKLIIQKK